MTKIFKVIICLLIPYAGISQNKLTLKSGETMNGEVKSIKDGILSFSFKGNLMSFKTAEISSIIFSESKNIESGTPAKQKQLLPVEQKV